MITNIWEKKNQKQLSLSFDCLTPEEAHTILDFLFSEDMDEMMCDETLDVNLGYDVNGYSIINGEKKYAHELLLTIEPPEAIENVPDYSVEEQLIDDRHMLEYLRELILEKTGIKEEES